MNTIAIIDYGSGNLRSAARAFEKVVTDENLDTRIIVTDKAETVAEADYIVLPGQGAFGDCMAGLDNLDGMRAALEEAVIRKGRPFLGICVGMQLMATRGLEHGDHSGLDWIAGEVVPILPADPALKIPHMGWNTVQYDERAIQHPVLQRLVQRSTKSPDKDTIHFYFVHSFMVQCKDAEDMLASTDYGGPVTAITGRDNMIGVQFHPEKSQQAGLELIAGFIGWRP